MFPTAAPLLAEHSETAIEGEYIVVFKNEIGEDEGKYYCTVHVLRGRGYGVPGNPLLAVSIIYLLDQTLPLSKNPTSSE
jgi:hypothetical protein